MSAKTDNRPEFQRMIRDSAKGLFDVIIVWKLDRFARNRYDSAHYKAQLRKNGVKVVSATENISDGPEGIILESMLEGMAEYYSAELSEKVLRGHTENALKCKYNGGTPTFGFFIDKDNTYQIDTRTAPVVLEIFNRYDQGATMKDIRDYLNDTGITTVRGLGIDLNFVSAVLHNRKYIGEYRYREIVVPDGIPAIVPQDLFDRVQERMSKNKKAPARHKAEDDYLLTTKLFCGTCKAFMVGESGTSSTGTTHHYYRCVNTKKHKTCNAQHKSIKKLLLENAVVNATMAKIMDDAFVEYIADLVMELQGQESSALPALRKQLEEAEKGIQNMPLAGLTRLSWLDLCGNHISDLTPLAGLPHLDTLYLSNNQITDLSHLSALPKLSNLFLEHNGIADLTPLSRLTGLQRLYLNGNPVIDLTPLIDIPLLQELSIKDCPIEKRGLAAFRKARPDCYIEY